MASIISAGTTSGTALNMAGDTSGVLQLATNGSTTAVTISTAQNVGIGLTNPSSKLHVSGDVFIGGNNNLQWSAYSAGTSGVIWTGHGTNNTLDAYTTGTLRMRIDSSGNLLVGTTTTRAKITTDFNGSGNNGIALNDTASATGTAFVGFYNNGPLIGSVTRVGATSAVAYNTTSDERLKSNIVDSDSVLDTLMQVQVRQYDWTEGNVHQEYGFIAQELEPILSGIVTKGKTDDDMWQLDYSRLTPHLVKAIQEQQTIINDLKARITALEGAA